MNTIATLQAIQDSEINFQIETFWDSGFTVIIGLPLDKSPQAISNFRQLQDGIDWLVEQVQVLYPDSRFTCNLQGREFDPRKCYVEAP